MAVAAIDKLSRGSEEVGRSLTRLRDVSKQVVGSVFYAKLLSNMRDSGFKGKYGHGGRAEEAFGAQLDALYAQHMGSATKGGLGEILYRCLEQQQSAIVRMNVEGGRNNE